MQEHLPSASASAKVTSDARTMTVEQVKTRVALAEYHEITEQFRALTNIRFKLLTYLPAGAAALGALVSKEVRPGVEAVMAAFGFIVTLSLSAYNARNDQHYDELIARAAQIEREHLKLPHGVYGNRPQSWLKYGKSRQWAGIKWRPISVEHRWPIGLIYAATCAFWVALFVNATLRSVAPPLTTYGVELAASLAVFWVWIRLRESERSRRKKLKLTVIEIIRGIDAWHAQGPTQLRDKLSSSIAESEDLFSIDQETARSRIEYAIQHLHDLTAIRNKSLLLAAVIDLPARWIEDVSSGRR
jgi:hypothetical protein